MIFPLHLVSLLSIIQAYGLQIKNFQRQTMRSEYNKYLTSHVFKTASGQDPQHCLADCWQENERCESFNYLVDKYLCELNNKSKENAPGDYIDRDGSVYFTNPAIGNAKKPQMPRHSFQCPLEDPCASNPCQNTGKCVKNAETGFRCTNCDTGYHGLMCEQREDACLANPCMNGGTCRSTPKSFHCTCSFPYTGSNCEEARRDYQFDLNGISDIVALNVPSEYFSRMSLWFWFKTEQVFTYFMSFSPSGRNSNVVVSVWKNGSTFYVELWRDSIVSFSFPYSYNVSDNTWHSVYVMLDDSPSLYFYLDGTRRHLGKRLNHYLDLPYGRILLGYYKDSNGTEHYYKGSISHFDMAESISDSTSVLYYFADDCIPYMKGFWYEAVWNGFHLAKSLDSCASRVPPNGVRPKRFSSSVTPQWLQQTVSPPRDLDSFTLSFWHEDDVHPSTSGFQIACYGWAGQCAISVIFQHNMTLAIKISSTTVEVDLIPIFDGDEHNVVITWTNQEGVLEVIIDAVLQSRLTDIETNATVPGQRQFLVGGSDVAQRNYVGYLNELNMWDTVLPMDLLYAMVKYPASDRGNVVAWKDFYKPSSSFAIENTSLTMTTSQIGNNYNRLEFPSRDAGSFSSEYICCSSFNDVTVTMWIKLLSFPAILMSFTSIRSNKEVRLSIDTQGNITWNLFDSEISLANVTNSSFINNWHFLGVTWSGQSGELALNLDGKYTVVSTGYKVAHTINPAGRSGTWYIGSLTESFIGVVGQTNVWYQALPKAGIRAMSRGVNNLFSSPFKPDWDDFDSGESGSVREKPGVLTYLPIYAIQETRDQYCNDVMPSGCSRYYARLGADGNYGMKWGCFCETHLAADKNFNFGPGNYSFSDALASIN